MIGIREYIDLRRGADAALVLDHHQGIMLSIRT